MAAISVVHREWAAMIRPRTAVPAEWVRGRKIDG
jgi:hypothetical protein